MPNICNITIVVTRFLCHTEKGSARASQISAFADASLHLISDCLLSDLVQLQYRIYSGNKCRGNHL